MAENDYIILNEDQRRAGEVIAINHDKANPLPAIRRQIALDLELDPAEVDTYFQYYYLNSRFPIRKLTIEEQAFCRAVVEIKYMDAPQLLGYLAQYHMTAEDHRRNRLALPMAMAGVDPSPEFNVFLKWSDYLLEPYLTYQNPNPPLLRPLSKMELFLIVSNVASGNSMIPGKSVEIRDQLAATQKLIDAYSLIPNEDQIEDEEETYDDLSPAELKTAAKLITEKDFRTLAAVKNKKKTEKGD